MTDCMEMMESGIETAAVIFNFTKTFGSVPHKPRLKNCKPLAWMSIFCNGLLTTSQTSVCCSERPRGLSWGPFQFSSFTSMELLSYKCHLRSNWLCMLMIFCCTGLLGKHLTINLCRRMLKHLENGLTIAI